MGLLETRTSEQIQVETELLDRPYYDHGHAHVCLESAILCLAGSFGDERAAQKKAYEEDRDRQEEKSKLRHHNVLEKASGTSSKVYALSGRLYLSNSGWLMMSVPNALGIGAFDALSEPGAELPKNDQGRYNAHVSVMRPEEIAQIGGPDKITERGHSVNFSLGPVEEVEPDGWEGVSKVWYLTVISPALSEIRRSYGLSSLPNNDKYKFHITFARRMRNVLRNSDVSKAASVEGLPHVSELLSLLSQGVSGEKQANHGSVPPHSPLLTPEGLPLPVPAAVLAGSTLLGSLLSSSTGAPVTDHARGAVKGLGAGAGGLAGLLLGRQLGAEGLAAQTASAGGGSLVGFLAAERLAKLLGLERGEGVGPLARKEEDEVEEVLGDLAGSGVLATPRGFKSSSSGGSREEYEKQGGRQEEKSQLGHHFAIKAAAPDLSVLSRLRTPRLPAPAAPIIRPPAVPVLRPPVPAPPSSPVVPPARPPAQLRPPTTAPAVPQAQPRPWGAGFGVQMPTRQPGVGLDTVSRQVVDQAIQGGATPQQGSQLARRIMQRLGTQTPPVQGGLPRDTSSLDLVTLYRGLRSPFQRFTPQLALERQQLQSAYQQHLTQAGSQAFPASQRMQELQRLARRQYFSPSVEEAYGYAGPGGQILRLQVPRRVAGQYLKHDFNHPLPASVVNDVIQQYGLRGFNIPQSGYTPEQLQQILRTPWSSMMKLSRMLRRLSTPKPPPLIQLLEAKAESDRKNYARKHQILRQLLGQSPEDFLIDSEQGGILGLTHTPTSFRIHLPRRALPVSLPALPPVAEVPRAA